MRPEGSELVQLANQAQGGEENSSQEPPPPTHTLSGGSPTLTQHQPHLGARQKRSRSRGWVKVGGGVRGVRVVQEADGRRG